MSISSVSSISSFSKEVKDYIKESVLEQRQCCKTAFKNGEKGEKHVSVCKKCDSYYIAGVFCSYGTMSDPQNSFQLFIYVEKEVSEHIFETLSTRLTPSRSTNQGKEVFYFKSCESVCDFLAFCKATPYSWQVYNVGIEKSEKARVQRECNAEVANIARAAAAAAEQLEAIKLLKKYNVLETLKKELQEAAELREKHPEAGLNELVSFSNDSVSKSGLNYRLKKLVTLAKEVKAKKE